MGTRDSPRASAPIGITSDSKRRVAENDVVILHGGFSNIMSVCLGGNKKSKNSLGIFDHASIIGKPYGSKVYDTTGKKWVAVLRPTPYLITFCLKHQTQLLYHADISFILLHLNAIPGKNVMEAGTGSGSLSCSIARAVSPGGQLYTFEYHKERHEAVKKTFELYGLLGKSITALHRDVCADGFEIADEKESSSAEKLAEPTGSSHHPPGDPLVSSNKQMDALFLDLPNPWIAVQKAFKHLKDGAHVVSFSPCIEQVQKFCKVIEAASFQNIRTFEILSKEWGVSTDSECPEEKVKKEEEPPFKKARLEASDEYVYNETPLSEDPGLFVHYNLTMRTHSGYLTVACKGLSDELLQPP